MKKVIEIIKCDIDTCGSEDNTKNEDIQVIFTTEQTEGRSCHPYLQIVKMDMCAYCKQKLLKGNPLFAAGAMGYNRYYFIS